MGIIQHLIEFYTWSLYYTEVEKEQTNPIVLSLDDLAFGFYIWLITFGFSILGFIAEYLVDKMNILRILGIICKNYCYYHF